MGTNYYHHRSVCEHCGRGDEPEHIGKSSAGWTFSFHGTEEIRSWEDWRKVLAEGGEIRDEYGEVVTLEAFEIMVEQKRGEEWNHTTYCRNSDNRWDRDHARRNCWLDPEGHSFNGGEFS